jgi:HK97 family phage major capsid protein
LNTAPVTTADYASPLRNAAAVQYIPSGAKVGSPATPALTSDALITTAYALNAQYRVNANWVMNSNTTAEVRKLKDTTGQYLWQPGLQLGQPDRLLGYGVAAWEQMSDMVANQFPIAFGNWQRGYVLADRVGLRVTRDSVTAVGFVKFYVRRREGGCVLNNDAVKVIKFAVS